MVKRNYFIYIDDHFEGVIVTNAEWDNVDSAIDSSKDSNGSLMQDTINNLLFNGFEAEELSGSIIKK